ncbi:hypothetical protein P43SY_006256 [Pythium insidiosum]|uniref:Uncharacterized protein n=1 Tax=Pythium insidiosum TaxID=114742 RepID=A0AAD5Q9G5_PYTIN|nr:hypothetical protein P43SY_006256 [Pythium insidiosum]
MKLDGIGPSQHQLRAAADAAGVELTALGFAVAWTGFYALHALCVVYFVAAGKIYAYVPTSAVLAWEMDNYIRTLPTRYFWDIAVVHYALAALHVAFLLHPIARALGSVLMPRRLASLAALSHSSRPLSARSLVRHSASALLSCVSLFSVQSEHFELVFVLREMTEVVLQSLQAYQMSIHIPRLVLNRVFVLLLVLNCWSTLLVHRFVAGKSLQRMVCLLADLLLDLVVSMGIPTVLSVTYIQEFDSELRRFPFEFAYVDKWFVNYINETPMILLGSWTDALSRLIFSLSLLVGLSDIKTLIRRRAGNSVAPSATATAAVRRDSNPQASKHTQTSRQSTRLVLWGHRLIAVYGVAILTAHVYAELGDPPESCVIPVRPWFTTRKGCALVELNCHPSVTYRVASADADAMNRVLAVLDAPSLAQLSVRHCHDVEMVPELQRFHSLLAMKLYNVTVASWTSAAALHADYHRRLCIVYIVYTTFPNHELPAGLLSPSFPPALLDVEFSFARLRALPSDLSTLWHKQMVLYFEYCGLKEFPRVLLDMQPLQLFVGGNSFQSLPPELFYSAGFDLLAVGANPLTELPSEVDLARLKGSNRLRFERTDISALPNWMNATVATRLQLFAGETPLCASIQTGSSSPRREEER